MGHTCLEALCLSFADTSMAPRAFPRLAGLSSSMPSRGRSNRHCAASYLPSAHPFDIESSSGFGGDKWDPHQDFEDEVDDDVSLLNERRPKEILCILLNCRKQYPDRLSDGFVRTREIKPRPRPDPMAIWLKDFSSSTAAS